MSELNHQAIKRDLTASLRRMQAADVPLPYLECGRRTHAFLIDWLVSQTPIAQAPALRHELEYGTASVTLGGYIVRRCCDVPEWAMYPPRDISPVAASQQIKAKDGYARVQG